MGVYLLESQYESRPCGPLKQPSRLKRSGRATADVASRREEKRTFGCIEGDCQVVCESCGSLNGLKWDTVRLCSRRVVVPLVGAEADRSTGCVLGVIGRVDGEEGRLRIYECEHSNFVGLRGYKVPC